MTIFIKFTPVWKGRKKYDQLDIMYRLLSKSRAGNSFVSEISAARNPTFSITGFFSGFLRKLTSHKPT